MNYHMTFIWFNVSSTGYLVDTIKYIQINLISVKIDKTLSISQACVKILKLTKQLN